MSDAIFLKAIEYSKVHLSENKRLTGETVFEHASHVVDILRQIGISDEITLSAAILHPLVVYEHSIKNIEKNFGGEIAQVISGYNELSKVSIDTNAPGELNESIIIQAYINMAQDIRAIVIRMADRLNNLKTSFALDKEKRVSIAKKALYLYAPVAKIVGLGKLSRQMEDVSFKILYPSEYFRIQNIVNKNAARLKFALQDSHDFVKSVLEDNKISADVHIRIKHTYSIYKKLIQYQTSDIRKINDIAAMRIVVATVEECYFVENILTKIWKHNQELRDDYIAKPRPSGYRSIHNIFNIDPNLNMEVQITTKSMHEENEFGASSHLLYKIGDKGAFSHAYTRFKRYSKENELWFKDLNFWELEKTINSFIPAVPFSKFVYAFTPKGDIIELPVGACLVDFAYAVHSAIGNKCVGGFANKYYVGLSYKIQNGDFVEIKTINKVNANRNWLDIVVSQKAREGIRKVLRI